ncbi:MAG: hypothetical protein QM803_20375 [Rhodocyclaceae bacterium]
MTQDEIVCAIDACAAATAPDTAVVRDLLMLAVRGAADALDVEHATSLLDGCLSASDLAPVAVALARRIAERFEGDGRAWRALGVALQRLDAGHAEIVPAYRRATELGAVVDIEACIALEHALRVRQRFAEADDVFPSILPCGPDTGAELGRLAAVRMGYERGDEAFWLMVRAAQLRPGDPVIRQSLSLLVPHASGGPEVLMALRGIADDTPGDADLHLAILKRQMFEGLQVEAQATCRLLMALDSRDPQCALAQAEAWWRLNEPEQAVTIASAAYRSAGGQPARLGTLLANALWDCGRHDESMAVLADQHLRLPDDLMTHLFLAEGMLRAGDWAQGWHNMEVLWRQPNWPEFREHIESALGASAWQGQSLQGKTLFVWQELQIGDGIWLARYLPVIAEWVKAQGGQMVFAAWRREYGGLLTRFLEHNGLPVLDLQDMQQLVGYHLPMLSCCRVFGFTDATLPNRPYMLAGRQMVEDWRVRLARQPGRLEVGLVWNGNPLHRRDPWRSMPVECVKRLCDIPNVRFHSVNPAACKDVAALRAAGCNVVDWSEALPDMDASAALLCALDVLVSVDTSAVHLAGSLGVPTLLMLDRGNAYLWGVDEGERTWYDSVRIFRQARIGDWTPVIERVKATLVAWPQTDRDVPAASS